MILADGGIIFIWVGVVALIGFVGFFAVLLIMIGRFFSYVWRSGRSLAHGSDELERPVPRGPGTCPNVRCGHENRRDARYCARCGMQLND